MPYKIIEVNFPRCKGKVAVDATGKDRMFITTNQVEHHADLIVNNVEIIVSLYAEKVDGEWELNNNSYFSRRFDGVKFPEVSYPTKIRVIQVFNSDFLSKIEDSLGSEMFLEAEKTEIDSEIEQIELEKEDAQNALGDLENRLEIAKKRRKVLAKLLPEE